MSTISITKRTEKGRKLERMRHEGRIPGVVYGPQTETLVIALSLSELETLITKEGETSIITLEGEGIKEDVLIHDMHRNPVTGKIEHVDFYVVDKKRKVTISTPLVFVGESPAVKTLGGNLVTVLHEIEIESLPADIPSEVEVDVSVLTTLESVIYAKDLRLPKGVELITDPETAVALTEGERAEEEEGDAPDMSSIERVGESKEEEKEA